VRGFKSVPEGREIRGVIHVFNRSSSSSSSSSFSSSSSHATSFPPLRIRARVALSSRSSPSLLVAFLPYSPLFPPSPWRASDTSISLFRPSPSQRDFRIQTTRSSLSNLILCCVHRNLRHRMQQSVRRGFGPGKNWLVAPG
jgi:hypothetical protein